MTGHQAIPSPVVRIKRLPGGLDLDLPDYHSALAAGCDIRAAIEGAVTIGPGERFLVPAGFAIALPPQWEAQIRPRSGLAVKYGISCVNSPGTIDADYRGEIKVILINHGAKAFTIRRGERMAQMVFAPAFRARFEEVEELDETVRNTGGFGSSGM